MADEIKSLDGLEAAVTENIGGVQGTETEMTPREPVRDELGRAYATGKRKDAVARVWIKPGSGKVIVNGKPQNEYFARPVQQLILAQPFGIVAIDARVILFRGDGQRQHLLFAQVFETFAVEGKSHREGSVVWPSQ